MHKSFDRDLTKIRQTETSRDSSNSRNQIIAKNDSFEPALALA